ncbi:MAG: hypothetical protein K8R92_06460 [Planctomycetes bacterium]|nr:hypothetical protein [Planctomycetota bacterium]
MASLALGLAASNAAAEVVTFSKVFTNTTNEAKEFYYEKFVTLTTSSGFLSGSGRLTLGVTDLRSDGASVSSVGFDSIYTGGFQQGDSFLPMLKFASPTPIPERELWAPYVLTALAASNASASFAGSFPASETFINLGDQICVKIRLVVSAGDQAVVSGNFTVVPMSGTLPLLTLAGIIGSSRRRAF